MPSSTTRKLRTLFIGAAVALSGCAHLSSNKPSTPAVSQTPTSAPSETVQPASLQDVSLSVIVNRDLQAGRYADGEAELRHYLQKHPGDHAAQSLLKQLTVDPVKMLGPVAQTHTVQPGESYSTIAAKYLGDANLFVVLARYNNAANPSQLRAGADIHLPASAAKSNSFTGTEGSTETTPTAATAPPAPETPEQKAATLQADSTAQYQKGNRPQALSLLDQALSLDPNLKSSGPESDTMRKELVANYHQRAIVLYRDQHLDEAIALWDRVLAIDPTFEPAAVYRARALELKQRLKQY